MHFSLFGLWFCAVFCSLSHKKLFLSVCVPVNYSKYHRCHWGLCFLYMWYMKMIFCSWWNGKKNSYLKTNNHEHRYNHFIWINAHLFVPTCKCLSAILWSLKRWKYQAIWNTVVVFINHLNWCLFLDFPFSFHFNLIYFFTWFFST